MSFDLQKQKQNTKMHQTTYILIKCQSVKISCHLFQISRYFYIIIVEFFEFAKKMYKLSVAQIFYGLISNIQFMFLFINCEQQNDQYQVLIQYYSCLDIFLIIIIILNQMWNFYSNSYTPMPYLNMPGMNFQNQSVNCYHLCIVSFNFKQNDSQFCGVQNLSFDTYEKLSQPNLNQVQNSSVDVVENDRKANEQASQQIKNRNMFSNSLKVFRKYISDSLNIKNSIIDKIIRRTKLDYSIQEFEKELNKRIPKQKSYYGSKFLSSILATHENSKFNTVFRILLRYYYKYQVFPTVLTSQKILCYAKRKQLIGGRKIYDNCFY